MILYHFSHLFAKVLLQTEFRKRAIRAVKKGNTKTSVAECLGVSSNIMTKWCKKEKTADTKLWKVINEAYQKEQKGSLKFHKKRN